jgi:hypothetical protein
VDRLVRRHVFNDTFDSSKAGWVVARTNFGSATLSGGALEFKTTSTGNDHRVLGKTFPAQTLANDGDSLRLTFTLKQNGTISLFRVGLFNLVLGPTLDDFNNSVANNPTASIVLTNNSNVYSGYYSFLRDNVTVNEARRSESVVYNNVGSVPTLGAFTTLTNASSPTSYDYSTDGTTTYQVRFDVTRVSTARVDTVLTLGSGATTNIAMSGTHTTTAPAAPYFTFNSAFFQTTSGTANTTSTLDNIKLDYIAAANTGTVVLIR